VSKRRKSHGQQAAPKRQKLRDVFVPRPFAGLVDEPEWIALRELVPAASAPLRLDPELVERHGDRPVTLATVLPMALPAMTKPDGRILIGLQRQVQSGDVSRDLAVSILAALETEPGGTVAVPALPEPGPRLQDILVPGPLEVTMHDGFDFWLDDGAGDDPNVKASLERANASIYPTVRLAAAPAAYWSRLPEKAHVRWVLPDEEDGALDALARLSAAGVLALGEVGGQNGRPLGSGGEPPRGGAQTRFAGMFRAHGLLVPVWDLPPEPEAEVWEAPLADFAKRYAEALRVADPLTPAERRARQGLLGRQLTLR
jgi:Family of unknown function (DUF5926)